MKKIIKEYKEFINESESYIWVDDVVRYSEKHFDDVNTDAIGLRSTVIYFGGYLSFGANNEKEYKQSEKEIDNNEIENKDYYTVSCGYDVSGYDYWMGRGEMCSMYANGNTRILRRIVPQLLRDMKKVYDRLLNISYKYNYDPTQDEK